MCTELASQDFAFSYGFIVENVIVIFNWPVYLKIVGLIYLSELTILLFDFLLHNSLPYQPETLASRN